MRPPATAAALRLTGPDEPDPGCRERARRRGDRRASTPCASGARGPAACAGAGDRG